MIVVIVNLYLSFHSVTWRSIWEDYSSNQIQGEEQLWWKWWDRELRKSLEDQGNQNLYIWKDQIKVPFSQKVTRYVATFTESSNNLIVILLKMKKKMKTRQLETNDAFSLGSYLTCAQSETWFSEEAEEEQVKSSSRSVDLIWFGWVILWLYTIHTRTHFPHLFLFNSNWYCIFVKLPFLIWEWQ